MSPPLPSPPTTLPRVPFQPSAFLPSPIESQSCWRSPGRRREGGGSVYHATAGLRCSSRAELRDRALDTKIASAFFFCRQRKDYIITLKERAEGIEHLSVKVEDTKKKRLLSEEPDQRTGPKLRQMPPVT